MFAIGLTVSDSGANLLPISEEQCKQMACPVITDETPALKAIDGQLHRFIIGHTPPVDLIIGTGTPNPLRKHVDRMCVISGNAGGTYDVLMDKETFKAWFAHVSPVYRHFIWFPRAPEQDFSVVAGMPVGSSSSKQAALLAQQQSASSPHVAAVTQRAGNNGLAAESSAAATAAATPAAAIYIHLLLDSFIHQPLRIRLEVRQIHNFPNSC